MKILVVGDVHLRATRPVSRMDSDYVGTIVRKLEMIAEIGNGVDLVLFLGDLVDRPDIPYSVTLKAMDVLKKFKRPPYVILGNHDLFAYSESTIGTSAVGVLLASGLIKRLDVLDVGPAIIYGLHAHDKTIWTVPDSSKTKILAAHKMLLPMSIPGADCYLVEDVAKQTNADVILSGDIHASHLVETNGKLFINPGSLSRMSINDRDRPVQVALLTVGPNPEDNEVEMVLLPTRPSEALFDLKSYSSRMASEAHSREFIKSYAHVVISVKAETGKLGPALAEFLEKNDLDAGFHNNIMSYYEKAETTVLGEIRD